MNKTYDVIIAGGGPVGLFLASELALGKASVLVLERESSPGSEWRVFPLGRRGLNTVSMEAFYRRGLLSQLFDIEELSARVSKGPAFQFGGHFAGLMLDAKKLDLNRHKYRIPGPALTPGPTTLADVERILSARAEELGVEIRRGTAFNRILGEEEESVTIETTQGDSFTGKWLVGCDGGRSSVRRTAGFEFVGSEAKFTGYAVKCDFDAFDKLKPGFHPTKRGMYILAPQTLYLMDFDGGAFDRTKEITLDHLQEIFHRISGIQDVNITKVHLASSFTDRCKQVTSYRKGRILLAGDAAHIHSPVGAQGLNTGLGDAMNLGWKLAAIVQQEREGRLDLSLLDTYEAERHPIGAWALEYTRVQVSLLEPTLQGEAMRNLIEEVLETADGTNLFIDRFWGISQKYDLGDGAASHPLVGASAPEFELLDGFRLGDKLVNGKGLLIDLVGEGALKEKLLVGKDENVDYITIGAKDRRGLHALLVRPDGVVAWLVEEGNDPNVDAAEVALNRWFKN